MFEQIESLLKKIAGTGNAIVWDSPEACPWLVVVLLFAGIFVTFRMGWINLRKLKHGFDVIRGRYDNPEDGGRHQPLPGPDHGALGHGGGSATSPGWPRPSTTAGRG